MADDSTAGKPDLSGTVASLRDIARRLRAELRVATNAEPATVTVEELALVEGEG